MTMIPLPPHPKNAPGDFYVENEMCLACMNPHYFAPELMGFDAEEGHCYFAQQPRTKLETDHAILAVSGSCVECLRYRGNDPEILSRFGEFGLARQCDQPLPSEITPVWRRIVTFDSSFGEEPYDIVKALARKMLDEYTYHMIRALTRTEYGALLSYVHSANKMVVSFGVRAHTGGVRRWILEFLSDCDDETGRGQSLGLDLWLRLDERFSNTQWYTREEWNGRRNQWRERPF